MDDPKRDRALRLIVVTGATATGKTRLAVTVAHALGAEIVSADSRQVYRGLDVGTGKDLAEYAAVDPPVPCHLLDVADPAEVYTLFHYQRDVYRVAREAQARPPFADGTPLVVCGGTPLYLAAVLLGYEIPNVPDDPVLRAALEARPLAELVAELARLDPVIHARTDCSTKRRVIRSLEVAHHARRGRLVTTPPLEVPLEVVAVATRVERVELHRRIDARLADRLATGLVEEVAGLLAGGLPRARLDQLGLEYRAVAAYLAGETSRADMARDLAVAIHRFARRQEIWLRSFPRRGIPLTWVDPTDAAGVLALARARWGEL